MQVEVYFNLHKKCWSVRHKGKVIKHTNNIVLRNVKFVVQPAGNAKVRQTGRKNVHAFVRGEMITPSQVNYDGMADDECHEAEYVDMDLRGSKSDVILSFGKMS